MYECGLAVWGGYFNDGVPRPAEHREGVYFFASAPERDAWRAALDSAARALGQCLASDRFEGEWAREQTIACCVLVVGQVAYPLEYNFGYGYDAASAHYMFEEGNYACDCNWVRFLRRCYDDVPGASSECGDTIVMRDFCVRREKGPAGAFVENGCGPRRPATRAGEVP